MGFEIRGSLEPFVQNEAFRFNPTTGYLHLLDYKGLSYDQMLAVQQDYVRAGIACEISISKGVSTMTVEDATQQYVIDSWQVVGNEEKIDGFSHPTILEILGSIDSDYDNYASLRNALESNQKPSDLYNDLVNGGFSDDDAQTVVAFYSLQQRGSTDYRRGQYVLKHTTNVPNRWGVNISDFGVDQIYSPAQLLTEVRDTRLWILPLPPRLVYKLGVIPPLGPQDGYEWGWLKGASTETTAANNRVDITTEYMAELWSLYYYDSYDGSGDQ
jgi:hypothetical protein